jgi:hypothetical protein
VHGAAIAARTFLETYLRYRHGRLPASRIVCASAQLRAQLAAQNTDGGRVACRRPARIVELHTHIQPGGRAASVMARVLDGHAAVLNVSLRLERIDADWEVSAVEHD